MSSIKQEFKSGTTGSYNGIDPLQVLSSDMHEVSVDPIKVEYMSDCEENPPVYFNEVMIKDEQQKNDTTMKDEYVTENEELQMKFEEFPEDSAVECTRDRENISIASSGDTNSSWSSNYKIQTTKTSADEHLHEHPNLHNNLNRETKAKTQHSPYSCDICKRTFKKLDKFKKHVRFHEQHNQTSERSFICSVCDKSFAKRFNLTVHLRTHTKERPYVCSICNKSFVQRQHLTAHQRKFRNLEEFEKHVHFKEKKQQTGEHNQTNERSFICSVCDKSFAKRFNLIVHLRTHTSERPHTCSICNRSFVQRQHLTAHQSTHTNERPL